MMRLLGATQTILPYARDYGRYILLAALYGQQLHHEQHSPV